MFLLTNMQPITELNRLIHCVCTSVNGSVGGGGCLFYFCMLI